MFTCIYKLNPFPATLTPNPHSSLSRKPPPPHSSLSPSHRELVAATQRRRRRRGKGRSPEAPPSAVTRRCRGGASHPPVAALGLL
ncbi:unnamed protein product [Urochloa humidicola]